MVRRRLRARTARVGATRIDIVDNDEELPGHL